MAEGWSQNEVDLTVDYYFEMLNLEFEGTSFVKADFERRLASSIGRSTSAASYKFRNCSAILEELGALRVSGYSPASNVQGLLRSRVTERFSNDAPLRQAMMQLVEADPNPAETPRLTQPSAPPKVEWQSTAFRSATRHVNYLEIEAHNRRLGLLGELAVLEWERRRLRAAGLADLATQVRHVAYEDGDGLGYDISSFEFDGSRRLVEVKTTRQPATTPFFVTENELVVSRAEAKDYRLLRVYGFGSKASGFYELRGALDTCSDLRPWVYRAFPQNTAGAASA